MRSHRTAYRSGTTAGDRGYEVPTGLSTGVERLLVTEGRWYSQDCLQERNDFRELIIWLYLLDCLQEWIDCRGRNCAWYPLDCLQQWIDCRALSCRWYPLDCLQKWNDCR
ncbi:hypothetical protein DPMN_117565 [Dreissena polymorpha]|uniref:Uncharacterized protein n=1 Tax=Dreissena polymorpha TaxID=45954 RepID=A0A9D4GIK7_DREPO|nr:hypothetical protein DPMN_117565 [Dreissena polymorpha]